MKTLHEVWNQDGQLLLSEEVEEPVPEPTFEQQLFDLQRRIENLETALMVSHE